METAAPQGRSLDCRMKVNGSFITEQEEVEVKKAKTFIWRPGKGLTEKVEAKINTLEDCDDFEDFQSENEDWESVDEYCSVATETVFPEMKTVTQYEEEEDWDKEMADSENNKNSYDLDDIIYCGGFRDGNGEASYSVHEEPLYDPSLHHVAPLTLIHLKAVTEDGQFEDAVD
ncbi:coordinator of PRMT5 and differentiation stimulator isoform X2 [Crotalus tigris]|uniref:coordinator of PRMT5 and differentiation stimulator isoform X2 n=2 Tax=Crotalus tigris TaxID=88082 RepID=UPI00192FAB35|nr:coordinator of PRMT5 and differentiation stimulator isoform X2 [Crotalus tigris]